MSSEINARGRTPWAPHCPPSARLAARVLKAEGRRRAAVLDGAASAAPGLEALERQHPLLAGLGADARDPAPLVMNDNIGVLGEQRDRSLRVMVRPLLSGLPHQPCVDQRPDGSLVPTATLSGGPLSRPRSVLKSSQRPTTTSAFPNSSSLGQLPDLRDRSPRHLESYRNLVVRVGDRVQAVAEQ